MEVAIIWLMSMFALDNEIQTVRADNHVLETEVYVLENELQETDGVAMKTATAHSAFYANQKVENDRLNDKIEALLERIEALENAPVNSFNTITE
jgi:predicted  nucleic acid-binding Zn-ribbon protein